MVKYLDLIFFSCFLNSLNKSPQKNILENLKSGKLDLIVGTHQLVNEKVFYNNLGLLIVDEEQKFGVNVKERIRSMKENIDVLTLTATPIPRTMMMTIYGDMDISLIKSEKISGFLSIGNTSLKNMPS